ncbi:hypothetical protein VTO42DRAFT_1317 [Malbranchea cinnamomea]
MSQEQAFEDWEFYRYDPSLPAAVIFATVFALSTALHFVQLINSRTWFFLALAIGGLFQVIGYIGRAISHSETPNWTLGPYIIQTLFILIAPALFAASIYMELGRIILMVEGEKLSLIKKRFLTKIFVTGDVLSFVMQGGGGGYMAGAKTADGVHTGENIVVGGLFVQIAFFGFFIITSVIFHYRLANNPTVLSHSTPWRRHLYALYGASVLILIRSIFRVIEYLQGNSGYLLSNEVFLYIFDALLMAMVMIIFNLVHPSEIKIILMGGKVERRGWIMMQSVPQSRSRGPSVSRSYTSTFQSLVDTEGSV